MNKPPVTFNDLGFSVSFVCDTLEALPTSGSIIHFTWPRRNRAPYPGGILMRVSPQNGPAWVGQFEPDDPYFPSGAYACPSGDALLVVGECGD